MENEEIQLNVKPKYKFSYMALPLIILSALLILLFCVVFALIKFTAGIVFMAIVAGIVAILIAIKVLIDSKKLKCYTYNFYKTKVAYRDGFLDVAEKEIQYKNVKEITMNQSVLERFFKLGTITLFTNAETGPANGITIMYVENVEEQYKRIKEIVNTNI